MNKFLQLGAVAALALLGMQVTAADVPKIGGYLISANSYPIWPAGLYSFTVDDNNNIVSKLEYTQESGGADGYLFNPGGSFYKNGYFYIVNPEEGRLLKFDPKSWKLAGRMLVDEDVLANQMAYDPSTDTVYACLIQDPGPSARYFFGTFDPETGVIDYLRELPVALTSMAVGIDGTLYAIGSDALFYGVIKETGALKRIGATGLDAFSGQYKAPMVCDLRTGKLYMARSYAWNYSVFYEVNPATGAATMISEFPNSEWYYNLFVDQNVSSFEAPALISDLAASYDATDNNVAVSFTIPATSVNGDALSGAVGYTVKIDNKEAFSGSDAPGTLINRKTTSTATGDALVSVILKSASGGESTNDVMVFAGYDTPKPVGDLKVEAGSDGNSVNISWAAPEEGVNNGYLEPETFTYTVVRYPEGKVVSDKQSGTTFTDMLGSKEPVAVRYGVSVNHHDKTSEEALSDKVITGPALTVPYMENFDDEAGFDRFVVEDSNNDGVTWERYAAEDISYINVGTYLENDKDDWAILPKVRMEPGIMYELNFSASAFYMTRPERMEVKLGKSPESGAMTQVIMAPEILKSVQSFDWHPYSYKFEVTEAGDYYIGFHAMSDADKFRIGVDDIRLYGTNVNAPAAVTENVAVPAPLGAHSFTLEFTAPATSEGGDALSAIDRAEVYLNGSDAPAAVKEGVAPGKKVTMEITNTVEGLNDYEVVCVNSQGVSLPVSGQVFTGLDAPAAPKNIKVAVIEGVPHITWDLPEGQHGGYIDPENITYVWGRYVNGGEQEVLGIATDTFADDNDAVNAIKDMSTVVYLVASMNDAGLGTTGVSSPLYYGGTPYEMPLFESFESGFGDYKCAMSAIQGRGGWFLWSEDVLPMPYDKDYGSIYYQPNEAGDSGRVFWGNVNVKGSVNPTIEFMYYNDPKQTGEIGVEVNAATKGWTEIARIKMDSSKPEGWTKASVAIPGVSDEDYVNFGFVAYTHEPATLHIDAIGMREVADDNLSVESLDCNRRLDLDKEATFTANVKNVGKNDAGSFRVDLYCDGDVIGSAAGTALAVSGSQKVTIKATPDMSWPRKGMYKAVVVYDKDQLEKDNASPEYEITVVMNKYPVTALNGTADDKGEVLLSWDAPDLKAAAEPSYICDDFESYETWLIDEIGEWTMLDRDRGAGVPLIGFHFPHYLDPRAFQVFSLERGFGIEFDYTDSTWVPHSGKTVMVSMFNANGACDDWMISPELSGEAQTVTFYSKSATFQYGLDEFDFLISEGGTAVKDFKVVDSKEVPAEWTEFTFDIPEGTKHFAIRSVGDAYALLVDDVMFKSATGVPTDIELIGYNVYSEDQLLTPKPIKDTQFATSLEGKESRRFTMTAVYNHGESARSNRITLTPGSSSGVEDAVAGTGVTIRAFNGNIFVEGVESGMINVYSPSGMLYQSVLANGHNVIPAPQGVWIVKAGATTGKVMIK